VPEHDVIVVGAGVAGLTAALFAARLGHATAVLAPGGVGGALLSINEIDDFPAFPEGVAGFELLPAMQEQAEEAGANFESTTVQRLEQCDAGWLLHTDSEQHLARAIIMTTGTRPRPLGIPGEREYEGKGLSHCASCDGPLFRGATVAVAGGGDSGLREALELTKHVDEVMLFEREADLSGQNAHRQRVLENKTIIVRCQTTVEEILGDAAIHTIRIRDTLTREIEEVAAKGLFVYVGREAETALLDGLAELDAEKRVVVNASMCTSAPGLFAAGDVRTGSPGHGVAAAGDGAIAATSADRYLRSR
jgi:thioredoxin reductase (NADPH)